MAEAPDFDLPLPQGLSDAVLDAARRLLDSVPAARPRWSLFVNGLRASSPRLTCYVRGAGTPACPAPAARRIDLAAFPPDALAGLSHALAAIAEVHPDAQAAWLNADALSLHLDCGQGGGNLLGFSAAPRGGCPFVLPIYAATVLPVLPAVEAIARAIEDTDSRLVWASPAWEAQASALERIELALQASSVPKEIIEAIEIATETGVGGLGTDVAVARVVRRGDWAVLRMDITLSGGRLDRRARTIVHNAAALRLGCGCPLF